MQTARVFVPAVLITGLSLTPTLARAQDGVTATAPDAVATDLPSVEELMEKAVEAAGGRKALDAIKTLHTVTTMDAMGQVIKTESFWSRDGGRIMKIDAPMGKITMGTDGEVSWMDGPMGQVLLSDEQADQLGQAGMHMMMLDPKTLAEEDDGEFTVMSRETFNDTECYKCRYVEEGSDDERFLYFAADTGLPAGFSQTQKGPGGEQTSIVSLEDWKVIEGVKFFHMMRLQAPGQAGMSGEIKVASIAVNTLDADLFALPDAIKELAEEQTKLDAAGGVKLSDLTADQQAEATEMLASIKQAPGVEALKRAMSGIEQGLPFMPAEEKAVMQYVVQELKKEIAARGG